MHRDSGRITTHSLEQTLVLFWLLRVFLHCLGQQSRLPEGAFALAYLTKALVPALVLRLSVLCRAQDGGASEPFLWGKLPDQVAAARCLWATAKPSGLPVLSAEQNEARDTEGVIKAPIMELCPFSSWLSQAELCSPAQLC